MDIDAGTTGRRVHLQDVISAVRFAEGKTI
jgi:hypothetical protein